MVAVDRELQYPSIGREEFLNQLSHLPNRRFSRVEEAYALAKYAHKGQTRKCGTRYFEHPRAVAWMFITELELPEWELIVMSLLHDTPEESFLLTPHGNRKIARQRLNHFVGRRIARGLVLLTHGKKQSDEEYMADFYHRPWWQVWRNHDRARIVLVKLADRLHNLRTLGPVGPEKAARKIDETRRLVLPLADDLVARAPRRYREAARYLREQIAILCEDPIQDAVPVEISA